MMECVDEEQTLLMPCQQFPVFIYSQATGLLVPLSCLMVSPDWLHLPPLLPSVYIVLCPALECVVLLCVLAVYSKTLFDAKVYSVHGALNCGISPSGEGFFFILLKFGGMTFFGTWATTPHLNCRSMVPLLYCKPENNVTYMTYMTFPKAKMRNLIVRKARMFSSDP